MTVNMKLALVGIAAAALASVASAQELQYFDNLLDFRSSAFQLGNHIRGIETFEESSLRPNKWDTIDDPLEMGVSNLGHYSGQGFAHGLTGLENLRIQTNMGSHDSETEQPQGSEGLFVMSAGRDFGATSDIVVSNSFTNATDIIYEGGTRAIGGRPFIYSNNPNNTTLRIDLYGLEEGFQGFIDSITVDADTAASGFWGVTSDVLIRRVNVFTLFGTEGLDDIEVWDDGPDGGHNWPWPGLVAPPLQGPPPGGVPEPATMAGLGFGVLALIRRRK